MKNHDAINDAREYHVFIPAAFDDLGLTLEAYRVYCYFSRLSKKECRTAYPSYKTIGEKCFRGSYPNSSPACLKAKAVAAVSELTAYGLIRKEIYDEGDGYKHNIYHLTPQSEWNLEANVVGCNIRKGRQGVARKSVNGDNPDRLTGITGGVNRGSKSVNPTPPKGINKGITNEGNTDKGNTNSIASYEAIAAGAVDVDSNKAKFEEAQKTNLAEPVARSEEANVPAIAPGNSSKKEKDAKAIKLAWLRDVFLKNYPYRLTESGSKVRNTAVVASKLETFCKYLTVENVESGVATEGLRELVKAGRKEHFQKFGKDAETITPKGSDHAVYVLPFVPDPAKWLKERRWLNDVRSDDTPAQSKEYPWDEAGAESFVPWLAKSYLPNLPGYQSAACTVYAARDLLVRAKHDGVQYERVSAAFQSWQQFMAGTEEEVPMSREEMFNLPGYKQMMARNQYNYEAADRVYKQVVGDAQS